MAFPPASPAAPHTSCKGCSHPPRGHSGPPAGLRDCALLGFRPGRLSRLLRCVCAGGWPRVSKAQAVTRSEVPTPDATSERLRGGSLSQKNSVFRPRRERTEQSHEASVAEAGPWPWSCGPRGGRRLAWRGGGTSPRGWPGGSRHRGGLLVGVTETSEKPREHGHSDSSPGEDALKPRIASPTGTPRWRSFGDLSVFPTEPALSPLSCSQGPPRPTQTVFQPRPVTRT